MARNICAEVNGLCNHLDQLAELRRTQGEEVCARYARVVPADVDQRLDTALRNLIIAKREKGIALTAYESREAKRLGMK